MCFLSILRLAIAAHTGEYRRHHKYGEDDEGMICFQFHNLLFLYLYAKVLLFFETAIGFKQIYSLFSENCVTFALVLNKKVMVLLSFSPSSTV